MAGVKDQGAQQPRKPAPKQPDKAANRPSNKMMGPGGGPGGKSVGYQTK